VLLLGFLLSLLAGLFLLRLFSSADDGFGLGGNGGVTLAEGVFDHAYCRLDGFGLGGNDGVALAEALFDHADRGFAVRGLVCAMVHGEGEGGCGEEAGKQERLDGCHCGLRYAM
jgi:hypothetical protein